MFTQRKSLPFCRLIFQLPVICRPVIDVSFPIKRHERVPQQMTVVRYNVKLFSTRNMKKQENNLSSAFDSGECGNRYIRQVNFKVMLLHLTIAVHYSLEKQGCDKENIVLQMVSRYNGFGYVSYDPGLTN